MVKAGKRGHQEVDTYAEDDFVENDDGGAPKAKKTKKASSSSGEDKFWELSSGKNPRRLNVAEFKGVKLINIREYYEKDGEYKPASKAGAAADASSQGISLSIDQYKALLKSIPELNAYIKTMGIDVSDSAVSEEESEEQAKPKKRTKAKKQEKANIEATSDEDEE
ncbi:ssDNA-binding transcriptional regulator [Diplocarpon rosae]|nr:ssDNA-binding transcriptional regulator [Diplocarpon rosae]